jgi:hypothetical protein
MLVIIGAHVRRHIVGYVALFVALGGTSYAAVSLPRNSVTAKQIAPGGVGSSELKNGAVTSAKVQGLRLEDFKPNELSKLTSSGVATQGQQGGRGAPGPQGPEGPQGPPGATGPPGPAAGQGTGTVYYPANTDSIAPGALDTVFALCPNLPGVDISVVVGGAASRAELTDPVAILKSEPIPDSFGDGVPALQDEDNSPDDGWWAWVYNQDPQNAHDVTVTAICEDAGEVKP